MRRALLASAVVLALAVGMGVAGDVLRPATGPAAAPSAEAQTAQGRITNGLNKCLENLRNARTVNNRVQSNVCADAAAQQWSRRQDLTIRTPGDLCLAPSGNRVAAGTPVVIVACNPRSTAQQWRHTSGVLQNSGAQRCLQFENTANAVRAVLANCNTRAAAQRWTVPAVSSPPPSTAPTTTTRAPAPTTQPTTTTRAPAPTTTTAAPPPTTTTRVAPAPTTTTQAPPPSTTTTVPTSPPTSPPAPQPAPQPRPFNPTGQTLWAADLRQPDVVRAGFRNQPSNRQLGDGAYNNPNLPWPIEIVAAPGDRAGRAVPYTLPDDAIRLETEPNHRNFFEGDDYYFGFAFYLAADFPLDTTGWQVIEQLHGAPGTGSPPVSFQAAKGGLLLDGGSNKPGASFGAEFYYQHRLMNLERERWYNVVYRVQFSEQASRSWVDVWVDGQQVMANFQPPPGTVYPPTGANPRDGTYRKQGLYHNRSIPGGTIFQAGHKLGTGYAAADPSR